MDSRHFHETCDASAAVRLGHSTPGALLVELLSDDGGSGTGACKEAPLTERRFRATTRLIRL